MDVWYFSPQDGYQRGIVEVKTLTEITIVVDGISLYIIKTDDIPTKLQLAGPLCIDGFNDLSSLVHANVPSMLEVLMYRYNQNLIYTMAGNTLISINPYKSTNLYSAEVNELYTELALSENTKTSVEPHLFQVANSALQQLQLFPNTTKTTNSTSSNHQTILLSGESGSGKSEAGKILLHYLSQVSRVKISAERKNTKNGIDVKQCILESIPVLEAFGNARTSWNDNSSRFCNVSYSIKKEKGRKIN